MSYLLEALATVVVVGLQVRACAAALLVGIRALGLAVAVLAGFPARALSEVLVSVKLSGPSDGNGHTSLWHLPQLCSSVFRSTQSRPQRLGLSQGQVGALHLPSLQFQPYLH